MTPAPSCPPTSGRRAVPVARMCSSEWHRPAASYLMRTSPASGSSRSSSVISQGSPPLRSTAARVFIMESSLSLFSYHALLVVESVIYRVPWRRRPGLWPAPHRPGPALWPDPGFREGLAVDVSLDGKVALVTGAGPNIGSGIALALARYGARVACNDLVVESAEAAVRRLVRNGGVGMALSGDVACEADVLANIAAVLDAWGRIDIVVNNAADLHARGLLEEDLVSFNRAVTVAAAGNFLFTKHAAIAMIERDIRGSIVSILSSNAWQGAAGFIAYAFHKGGLANFVRAAAMDLAPYGIRVN